MNNASCESGSMEGDDVNTQDQGCQLFFLRVWPPATGLRRTQTWVSISRLVIQPWASMQRSWGANRYPGKGREGETNGGVLVATQIMLPYFGNT